MRWKNTDSVINPRTNAHGLFSWPCDPLFPVDVSFYTFQQAPKPPLDISRLFCDQSYLGMVFRKSVGMTPGLYRRQFSGSLINDGLGQELLGGKRPSLTANHGRAFEKRPMEANSKQSERVLMKPGGFIQ